MRTLIGLLTGLSLLAVSSLATAETFLPSIQQIVERGKLRVAVI